MNKIVLALLLLFTFTAKAQVPFYKTYHWEKNPDYQKFETDTAENLMSFKDKTVVEFFFENKSIVEYFLEHRILWLNSDEVIDDFNKIYLPFYAGSELIETRARVINPGQKIQELDGSGVLLAKDEESGKSYKYFALEGVQKGSFVEYYYILKRIPQYQGKKINLQENFIKKNVEFSLYAPENLVFEIKTYHGLPPVEIDTTENKKMAWKLSLPLIEKFENEERAPNKALLKSLVYKLERNLATNVFAISSYANISANLYSHLFLVLSKNQESAIKKFIKQVGLEAEKDDVSKIRKLENYLKANFYISENNTGDLEDLTSVIKNKAGNDVGLIRLFIAVLKSINIPVEVVLTCDRFENRFDEKFEAANFLSRYMLYFPSVKMYTEVDKIESRLGYPSAELTDNFGLFIKEVSLGEFKSGVGKVRYIDAPPMDASRDNMNLEINFDKDDLTLCHINYERSYQGYYAKYIQPYLSLTNDENLNELYDQVIKSFNESISIKSKKALNAKTELFGLEPFKMVAELESHAFVDKAGNKYLFKLGELIGPQIEMYQEKARRLPLETDFKRKYQRIIRVSIPEGYTISGLDKINISHFGEKDGKRICEFNSRYTLEDQNLTVFADEWYDENKIGLELFEDYRKVINSAADFNKIVLVLEKSEE